HDLRSRCLLFESALRSGNEATMRARQDEIHQLEGEEGTFWRYAEAARLLYRAGKGDRAGLEQARQQVQAITRRRPDWPRLALLEAHLHEAEGRSREAADACARAVRLGDRRPDVLRRLARLLSEQQRFDDLDELLRKMPFEEVVANGLGPLASLIW